MDIMFVRLAILVAFSLAIDCLVIFGLKRMLRRLKGSSFYKLFFKLHWWASGLLLMYFVGHFLWIGFPGLDYEKYRSFFFLFGIYILIYFPRILFSVFIIWQLFYYKIKALLKPGAAYIVKRSKRHNYIIQKLGLFFSFLSFFFVLYGIIWGKSDFVVREQVVYFKDLPIGFDGFRIAHISDMHLGSFKDPTNVKKGLSLLQGQDVDIILFTGDMVNNVAAEMDNYLGDLASLDALYGKYSILGNHDMGDYVKWKKAEMKYQHIQELINKEKAMGFQILLNENRLLYRGGDSIALLGVENWGKPPFKQYGDLKRALRGVEQVKFKVLMSHDPSHYIMEVEEKTDIQLTLAGHTHGMQMGINFLGFKWSPAQWLYPRWNGLYGAEDQYLYVNPGFGFIGMPARIGIRPEITIITLKKESVNE